MPRLPHLVSRLQGFGTTIFSEVTALAVRHGAVNLGQGFPDFEGPGWIKRAAIEAIEAGHEVIVAVSALTVGDYRPQLRAGLHTGEPRAVGDDFLGVDVNVAARVAAAAGAGELLASGATVEAAGADRYATRRRRFRAKGVPRDIEVFAVVPRYSD